MSDHTKEIDALIAEMTGAETAHPFRRARAALRKFDSSETVESLIRATRTASNRKFYNRAVRLLAEYGTEEAVEALTRESRTQRRYPKLAMRALSLCDHPAVDPVLLDLLELGRMKQRSAAAFALARRKCPMAIEPLCKSASMGERGIGPEAFESLKLFGRPDAIATMVLNEPSNSPADCVRVLQALSLSPIRDGFFRTVPFDVKRFLARESQSGRSKVRDRARLASDFLLNQSTLLRITGPVGSDALLRAASGSEGSHCSDLLRVPTDDPFRAAATPGRLDIANESGNPSNSRGALLGLFVSMLARFWRRIYTRRRSREDSEDSDD